MRDPEWVRWCALNFIRAMVDYRKGVANKVARIAELRAKQEAVGAVRYDRDGSPAGYTDRGPETLDTIATLQDDLLGDLERGEVEYQRALDLFAEDPDATIVWLKYGERLTWEAVGRAVGFTGRTCRTHAPRGLRYIFDRMPVEYRRAPVNAEEWER